MITWLGGTRGGGQENQLASNLRGRDQELGNLGGLDDSVQGNDGNQGD